MVIWPDCLMYIHMFLLTLCMYMIWTSIFIYCINKVFKRIIMILGRSHECICDGEYLTLRLAFLILRLVIS